MLSLFNQHLNVGKYHKRQHFQQNAEEIKFVSITLILYHLFMLLFHLCFDKEILFSFRRFVSPLCYITVNAWIAWKFSQWWGSAMS